MILSDLHLHTQFSDGKLSIPEIVDFFGSRGFGAIAITDHLCEERTVLGKAAAYLGRSLTREQLPQYFETIRSEGERAWSQYRMKVIPGYEITKNTISNHRSAHLLVLGVEEYIAPDQDLLEIAKTVRSLGGLSVAAHPVWERTVRSASYHLWDRRHELQDYIDAWEATDSGYLIKAVMNSRLPKLATSDFHRINHMSSWKTVLNCEAQTEAIFDAIRRQKLRFHFYGESQKAA